MDYNEFKTAYEKAVSHGILSEDFRKQMDSFLKCILQYWEMNSQYNNLVCAENKLKNYYDEESRTSKLFNRLFIEMLYGIYKEENPEGRESSFLNEYLSEDRTLKVLEKHKCTDETIYMYLKQYFRNSEPLVRMKDMCLENYKDAINTLRENITLEPKSMEEAFENVLHDEGKEMMVAHLKNGTENDIATLFLMITPCRKTLAGGDPQNMWLEEPLKIRDKIYLSKECKHNLQELAAKINEKVEKYKDMLEDYDDAVEQIDNIRPIFQSELKEDSNI